MAGLSNAQRKIPTDLIVEAYMRTRNVWKAGAELGIAGQTVHKRIKKLGLETSYRPYTEAERARVRAFYTEAPPETFDLAPLVKELGRPKTSISKLAGEMGLTSYGRPMSAAHRESHMRGHKGKWANKPHPRGFQGRTHTEETKAAVSAASKRSWVTAKTFGIGNYSPENREKHRQRMSKFAANRPAHLSHTRARGGKRDDLGDVWFRSSWEANYARYLNLLIRLGAVESWEFEPQTFWFEGIKRGVCSYRPDFCVKYKNDPTPEWVELKGWVQAKDHTKWKRMKKYHPHIKLVVVKAKEYYAIQKKWASSIPNWESDRKRKCVVTITPVEGA